MKMPLKDKDNDNEPGADGGDKLEDYTDDVFLDRKAIKVSMTDSESGCFSKVEHKHVFPYKRPIIKAVFSRGMSMFMINTMTVTSVLLTIC